MLEVGGPESVYSAGCNGQVEQWSSSVSVRRKVRFVFKFLDVYMDS